MNKPSEASQSHTLTQNVSLLGRLLGEIISEAEGDAFYQTIEAIRRLSKSARAGNDLNDLHHLLDPISNSKALGVARAFGQFLTLANIADQHDATSLANGLTPKTILTDAINQLRESNATQEALTEAMHNLSIDLVLTAHPTEIIRRTMVNKHADIDACLDQLDQDLPTDQYRQVLIRLKSLITQIWYSRDFRVERPSPIDEAKGGFAVVERSLWRAVPDILRELEDVRAELKLDPASLDWVPIRFSSWMGGDRDGNPNVTAAITQHTLLLSRWQSCDLFARDLNQLIEELSVTECSAQLRQTVGERAVEPYRTLLRPLRDLLEQHRTELMHSVNNGAVAPQALSKPQLQGPLRLAYQSLSESGMKIIADGTLLDTLRRVEAFGPHLVRLDIRQESSRHSDAMTEIVDALGLGDYQSWSESEKCAFLMQELSNPRPLLPKNFSGSPEVVELLATLDVIAAHPPEAFGAYVISMASSASDVLCVHALLQDAGCTTLPVSPLFETLDDLKNAHSVIQQVLGLEGFKEYINRRLMIMIGYSDSAKDAGVLAAAWAQYQAQESLIQLCAVEGIELILFHGRGGTIGRGGAPAQAALMSQPPGSLRHGLRVTEQGEMIRTKLGRSALAANTLALYSSAILQANINPPPKPESSWRQLMDRLAAESCDHYRSYVKMNPDFLVYFRQATPEQELANLPLGSRPARRRAGGGIESLRAIPWIFAWSQNRLLLPAWLGAGSALCAVASEHHDRATLKVMIEEWPFFKTRLSMLEMVYAKADLIIAEYYDDTLVEQRYKPLGAELRAQLVRDTEIVLELLGQNQLLELDAWGKESIRLRNIYTSPLNLLQAALLRRARAESNPDVEQAIMVSIAGIAAGLRNTG
jgi:phosphoenolpyruvate carboxylase